MIRLAEILTVFFLFAAAAQAQELTVRSGNHPTFARLTLPLNADQKWDAKRTADSISVTLSNHTGGFDISAVFTRIPRDRVIAVESDSDTLSLRLACACRATTFRSANLLVIDVTDPGMPLAGPLISSMPASDAKRPQEWIANRLPRRGIEGIVLPWIGSSMPFWQDGSVSVSNDPKLMDARVAKAVSDRSMLLQRVQKTLIGEVATAASMGLLDSSYTTPQTPEVQEAATFNSARTEPIPLPKSINTPQHNMRITSSVSKPTGHREADGYATGSGMTCPEMNVETWGDDRSFAAQIGLARDALVNARDQLDQRAAIRLSQLYIYFGFGAEALDVLQLEPALVKQNAHLAAIATILERGAVTGPNPLAAYSECGSDIALWASLSFSDLPSGLFIDTKAALRALNKLPKHLRRILAPPLSDRFLQYSDPQSAAAALRSVERLHDQMTPDGVMAQAALSMDAGAPAHEKLEDVIQTNSAKSPEALVRLVESKLSRDEPLPYETATLVEAYAQELRGTEMGNLLRRTQVIALSQSAHFDEAFSALDALLPSISPQNGLNLRQTILEHLAKKADDVPFLEHYFRQDRGMIAGLPSKVKLMLASRLMNLGFAAQVQTLLTGVPDRPRKIERQMIAARAALALQQPFRAQAALIGIDRPEAAMLMAQAKEMAGAYREAAEIFDELDAGDRAADAAWLSEDWKDMTRPETPGFGPVAVRASAGGPAPNPTSGPLARADSALEESRVLRDSIQNLLSAPKLQINLNF